MEDYILSFRQVSKVFPGVKALDNVSFDIKRGQIHALMGENGAGKSTLIKILAGINTLYEGQVLMENQPVHFSNPSQAQKMGISVVHQEIKLAETLSVTENIFLGNLLYKNGLVDWKGMEREAKKMLSNLGMDIDSKEIVDNLTLAKKQIVEICRAIRQDCKILIMDEPSATLTDKELAILFKIMQQLVSFGITIIYISHRMEEIFQLSHSITILRDGKHIATIPTKDCHRQKLIQLMVGRSLESEYPKQIIPLGEVILRCERLSRKPNFSQIDFTLKRGEILGFSGLVGAGRTEVMRSLLGIDPLDSGEIILRNKKIQHHNFKQAINNGFGLIPEDRKVQGLVQIAKVKENICLVSLRKIIKRAILRPSLEAKYAHGYVKKLSIATPDIDTQVQYLSGGNQQKVVIAKWLMEDSNIIIMDEPTRGIDVGAKTEIYKLMGNLVQNGKSIIMISSELPEILGMCDRIVVMHEGRKVGELSSAEATQEKIMALCV